VSSSDQISPTAHYTGYVWARNGLSHPELETIEGRVLFEALRPVMIASRFLGQATLEPYLLVRHRALDSLLEDAIEQRGVTQVIEVAAGLSARGWRFGRRYGDRITYIEADLPGMAQRKRRALARMGSLGEHHRVAELDALRDQGPGSLAGVASELDTGAGLLIITEGLLGYLPRDAVDGIWQRFASTLSRFPTGLYISDIHLGERQTLQVRGFRVLLSAFVRSRVHIHFHDAAEAVAALQAAGFTRAEVRAASDVRPAGASVRGPEVPGASLAHILEASTT
jgi:O-methyltransferase involved in polyketide biosynthesis